MAQVVLLTGGNLAGVAQSLTQILAQARAELSAELGVELACSSLWESEAWGFESEDRFLNQVLVIETQLLPLEVLARSQEIELRHGRVRDPHKRSYASRTLDIDILFYDDHCIGLPTLEVPHPRIAERLFVLCPLAEILPERVHPTLGVSVVELLKALRSTSQGSEPTRLERSVASR